VTAKVWLKAMPDGRSIAMKCQIANDSKRPVGQVLFPDFHGLLPFAGKEETCLRTAGFVRKPFVDVQATTYPEFYALDRLSDTKEMVEFYGGGKYGDADSMIERWLDFGGLNGGISLFPKVWADAPVTKVRIYRLEKDPNVRLMHVHDTAVKPGQTWESPEYVLTPHRIGWAKGIEPYREFVRDHIKRQFPCPSMCAKDLATAPFGCARAIRPTARGMWRSKRPTCRRSRPKPRPMWTRRTCALVLAGAVYAAHAATLLTSRHARRVFPMQSRSALSST